ncbi:MAG TPA: hypothetical protein VES39_04870 [Rhodospirillales bacterium]|nr:hypothetical protein [Rhodospirillales bacterium]
MSPEPTTPADRSSAAADSCPSATPAPDDKAALEAGTPDAAETAGIVGYFRVAARRLTGWAWDSCRPELTLEVEARKNGVTLARMLADRFRPDLRDNGVGTGAYGFACDLAEPVPAEAVDGLTMVAFAPEGGHEVALLNRSNVAPDAPITGARGREPAGAASAAVASSLAAVLAPAMRKVTAETIRTSMQALLETVSPPVREATEKIVHLQAVQQEIACQLQTLEVVQSRIDSLLCEMEARLAARAAAPRQGDRGLRITVALLALLSLVSLAVGIRSIWLG